MPENPTAESVLPNENADAVDISMTPEEIKKFLGVPGVKQLVALMREVFLLSVPEAVNQVWLDTNYYTGSVHNYGNTIEMNIQPVEDINEPIPEALINRVNIVYDASGHFHMYSHIPDVQALFAFDPVTGKLQMNTMKESNQEHNSITVGASADEENVYKYAFDEGRFQAVLDPENGTVIKTNNYIELESSSHCKGKKVRIVLDSSTGRAYLLSSDPVRYVNNLTAIANKTGEERAPQSVARIVDVPTKQSDLENWQAVVPYTGSKEADDTNPGFFLPYTETYPGIQNREASTIDNVLTTKNDFNYFWNLYNRKVRAIDADRSNLWNGVNRLRNTGHYLGGVKYLTAKLDDNVDGEKYLSSIFAEYPETAFPADGLTTTWGPLRTLLNIDPHMAVFDNDVFVVEHNNDTYLAYNYSTERDQMTSPANPDYRVDLTIPGMLPGATILTPKAIAYVLNTTFKGNYPSTQFTLQNAADNMVFTYNSGEWSSGVSEDTIRNTIQQENTYSQQPDGYTWRPRLYTIKNLDPNAYAKTGSEGISPDTTIRIIPGMYMDNFDRNFADPYMPLGRGRIKNAEIEDGSITLNKLDNWLQSMFNGTLKVWGYSTPDTRSPDNFGINSYNINEGNGDSNTYAPTGYNAAFNLYTKVMWLAIYDDGSYTNGSSIMVDPKNNLLVDGSKSTPVKWVPIAGSLA